MKTASLSAKASLVVLDYASVKDDWGIDKFNEVTHNGTRSLLLKGAFDPTKCTDSLIATAPDDIKYTTKPLNFKQGLAYSPGTVASYLETITEPKSYYCSWGHSAMNDSRGAVSIFQNGAKNIIDVLPPSFKESCSFGDLSADTEIQPEWLVGHFIAGNTPTFSQKTPNHFVWTINHVFQLQGEKTWYICAITDAMKHPAFLQNNPMEYALSVSRDEYEKLDMVHAFTVAEGDYFYNAPLVGHAVAMGPGKNVMLSLRADSARIIPAPEWTPLMVRTIEVTRSIIHSDVKTFLRFKTLTVKHDTAKFNKDLDGDKYLAGNVGHKWESWKADVLYSCKRWAAQPALQASCAVAMVALVVMKLGSAAA